MSRFDIPDRLKIRPFIQLAPLVDVLFLMLIFFMTLFVFQQMETELSISVPKAKESKDVLRGPGEMIINIDAGGQVTVNQRKLAEQELRQMLQQIAGLYPTQPIIIRADKKTYHEPVIRVLDACAAANMWNISFTTLKQEKASK